MDAGRSLPNVLASMLMVIASACATVTAEEPFSTRSMPRGDLPSPISSGRSARLAFPVPLENLPKAWQDTIFKVIQQPTMTATAPLEEFRASTEMYQWLLDHPDRTSLAWKRLKIAVIDIRPQEGGRFLWQDDQGSELVWRTVAKNGDGRIWYAEGKVRPGALLPLIPVKAVAVLQHRLKKDAEGEVIIRHQVEVYLQTDSKCAALVTRMIGPAAPRMAEQGTEQLLLFFSGIARYTERYPDRVERLLAERSERP